MNKSEYFDFHKAFTDKMVSVTAAKNHDYTGSGDDPFANFRRCEQLGVCSVEQGFLVRMTDKLARIASFVQQGSLQVKDESVQDTLLDLANYSALLAGYIVSATPPETTMQELENKLADLQATKAQLHIEGSDSAEIDAQMKEIALQIQNLKPKEKDNESTL